MIYEYNEEQNRIISIAWNPCFFIAQFKDTATGDTREMPLHTEAAVAQRKRTVAEKYASATEQVVSVTGMSKTEFEKWLCPKGSVTVQGLAIPASFVTNYLIAEDHPSPTKRLGRYGDLSEYRTKLFMRDENLLTNLKKAYEDTFPEKNIVREAPDIPHEKDALLEAYKECLKKESGAMATPENTFLDCELCSL